MANMDRVVELFTLLGLSILVVILRMFVRIQAVGLRRLEADDFLVMLGMAAFIAESTLAYQVNAWYDGFANSGMTEDHRATLDPNGEEYMKRVDGSKTQMAGWVMYALVLWSLKAAMCSLFLRLTSRLGSYKIRIQIGFGLLLVTWLSVTLAIIFSCTPIYKNWQVYPDPGLNCQPALSRINIFVTLLLNVATDLYLLTIPLPLLWSANIKPMRKLGLILLFSGAVFVMLAGVLRCVLILANDQTGAIDGSAWAVRETFVAVMTTNLPVIFPLIKGWIGSCFGIISSIKESRPTGVPHGSIPLPDGSWSRKGGQSRFDNGGNTFVHTGSQERIVDAPNDGIKVEMNIEVSRSDRKLEEA
ncbi:hypothetical protein JX266_011972 [Neoarthrinium moseri]|nr:hypothetical protein JX266_011972 [Neoarthrinium moseri]